MVSGIIRCRYRCILCQLPLEPDETMRTTITVDDELLETARAISGVSERNALMREGLKALIERESARRLARLGGSEPAAKVPPRRRSPVSARRKDR